MFPGVRLAMDAAGLLIRAEMTHRYENPSPATGELRERIREHIAILEDGMISMDALESTKLRKVLIKGIQALLGSLDDLLTGKTRVLLIEAPSNGPSRNSYKPPDEDAHYPLYDSYTS